MRDKLTNMSMQLVDRLVKYPIRVLKDASIKVGYLYIPIDFIIMDIKEESQVSIIVGRPFLYKVGTIVDVKRSTLSMEVGDKKIEFIIATLLIDLYTKVSFHLIEAIKSCD